MKCPKCFKEIPDDSSFCMYCGKKIDQNLPGKFTNGEFIAKCPASLFHDEYENFLSFLQTICSCGLKNCTVGSMGMVFVRHIQSI